MSNAFYNASGSPTTGSPGASSVVRAEFVAISNAFNLMPAFTPIGSAIVVNAGGNGLTNTVGALALAGNFSTTGAFNTVLAQQASVTLTLPATADTLVGRATPDTLTNKTLTAPVLGGTITGTYTLAGTPTIQGATINGNAITTGSGTLTLGAGKILTASNTLTLTGTDGASVNFGTGGTVLYSGSAITLLGDVTGNTGATVVSKIAGVAVGTPTGTGNVVMSASPTLSGTIGGALTFSGALTLSAALTYGGVTLTNAVTGTGKMLLQTSPTLTGTVTGPDAGTWTSAGLNSLAAVGVGLAPAHSIDVSTSDGQIRLFGTTSLAMFRIGNSSTEFGYFGDAKDTLSASLNATDLAVKATNDLFAAWGSTSALFFWKGLAEVGRFGTDGSLLVGTTTNAGAGAIADSLGNVRDIPVNTQTAGYTLVASDNGKQVIMNTTGNVTVPNAVFAANKNVVISNLTGGPITLIQGSGLSMIFAGQGTTGNRTLAHTSLVTLVFQSSGQCLVSGAGIT